MLSPQWIGPLYVHDVMYLGAGSYMDFYFICRINDATQQQQQQQQSTVNDDGARFEVVLTFDSKLSSVTKTTTSATLDVRFTSQDFHNGFGTNVWFLFTCFYYRLQVTVLHIFVDYAVHKSIQLGQYWNASATTNTHLYWKLF